ncbi:SDR family oxidoreductase [Microvirga brassicacearum]|uniref:SDR family oxidoreductase n=1 Tax=Microvirga brassicacearum TaxID=2580413 RepID=A0A5N3PCS6_9HYPH|nr:SDR family oxidoreductase [Microvirga brassicacearum]KAB0267539.1 SDR family oxidoreductase [Microvirga brassicacearum]
MNLFVFGFGYTAQALVRSPAQQWSRVAGTVRDAAKAERLRAEGIAACTFEDVAMVTEEIRRADAILVSTPPADGADPTYARYAGLIEKAGREAWLGYLSTTGVYGDQAGGWVDETVPPDPRNGRSSRRVEAERSWLELGARSRLTVAIFRLAGIYGPGRNAFVSLARGTAQRIVKPGQVSNRIHVDDIAAVLAASIARPRSAEIYNVSDNEPAPPQDIIAYAAKLAGIPVPPDIPFERAELSPMSQSFYAENKRISNRLIREELGVRLRYPTYREGLEALYASGEYDQAT